MVLLLVSIHGLLRALTGGARDYVFYAAVSIHGLLRALTRNAYQHISYRVCFNPRALTSPDIENPVGFMNSAVSIHGLLRALTSFSPQMVVRFPVSIHGLLRALTEEG